MIMQVEANAVTYIRKYSKCYLLWELLNHQFIVNSISTKTISKVQQIYYHCQWFELSKSCCLKMNKDLH